jgi:hypothetical protein
MLLDQRFVRGGPPSRLPDVGPAQRIGECLRGRWEVVAHFID